MKKQGLEFRVRMGVMPCHLKRRNVRNISKKFFFLFYFFYTLTPIFSLLFLSGCADLGTYNPATGRKEFILISTPEEVQMGTAAHQKILEENQLSQDPLILDRIYRIGQRVARVSDRKDYTYQFFVIDKDEINAFTTPGGNVYVYTGLLSRLKTDDQVASVLAHEIGHCAARHTVKKFQAALSYSLIGGLILNQIGEDSSKVASLASDTVMGIVSSAYSRQDELEADRLGIKYLNLAGYNIEAMIEVFAILREASKWPEVPTMLSTHPHLGERMEAAKKEIQNYKK